ncbi:3-beta-hydroxysteroid-Delta [Penicillium rolfsii]|nr:3-beta-hydroxysteroid-Delta [Penicillium rolfsii]
MEAVTAFAWGPLAFLIAYCIAVQHPVRHALQIIISTGQVYGDVLYYATSLIDVSYSRPERYYFWFYYFFFNFIWMAVGCCKSSLRARLRYLLTGLRLYQAERY